MRYLKIPILAAVIVGAAFAVSAFSSVHKTAKKATAASGFAVVELFTSEGCSSCPPADALVSRIQKESTDKPVYILAYHVDYWNRLGWRDPYSSAAYSQRQRKYSGWLHSSSVYTPQIVVNGRKEFVGSEEGTLRNTIKSASENVINVKLKIMEAIATGKEINYWYRLDRVPENVVLMVALVQKQATTNVKAGENSGRTLSHVQIVRQLQTVPLNSKVDGTGQITIPNDAGRDLEIIVFLQSQSTGQILAADGTEPTTDG